MYSATSCRLYDGDCARFNELRLQEVNLCYFSLFTGQTQIKIMWEYCTLFELDLDENSGMLDDGDRMRIEDYKTLMDFSYFVN